MADEIFMDVPAVNNMTNRFNEVSQTLTQVSNGMEAAITLLKTSAFTGMFGNYALANYLENLKPVIDNFAERCSEMADDLKKSAEAYERGDALGAAKFH